MSSPAADGCILEHLERLIAATEVRTSTQTATVMALIGTEFDSREEEEALWRSMDNLLALRRQQMQSWDLLVSMSSDARFWDRAALNSNLRNDEG